MLLFVDCCLLGVCVVARRSRNWLLVVCCLIVCWCMLCAMCCSLFACCLLLACLWLVVSRCWMLCISCVVCGLQLLLFVGVCCYSVACVVGCCLLLTVA